MEKYPDTWEEEHKKLVEKAVRAKLGDSNIDIIVRRLVILFTENTSRERLWPEFLDSKN
jgi:hypothetical protein